jgi:hypothetical protein
MNDKMDKLAEDVEFVCSDAAMPEEIRALHNDPLGDMTPNEKSAFRAKVRRIIDFHEPVVDPRDAALTKARETMGRAWEALKIGIAWTEDYRDSCIRDGIDAEVVRVQRGLTEMRAVLAAIDEVMKGAAK